MQENNRLYEVGFHLIPTLEESEAKEKFEAVKKILEKSGAKVVSTGSPELISLAYQMSRSTGGAKVKYDKAYFSWLKFEIEPAQLGEIKEELEHNESVLRFLIIQTVIDGDHTTNKLNEQLKKQNKREDVERDQVVEFVGHEIIENVEKISEEKSSEEKPIVKKDISEKEKNLNLDDDVNKVVDEIISGK